MNKGGEPNRSGFDSRQIRIKGVIMDDKDLDLQKKPENDDFVIGSGFSIEELPVSEDVAHKKKKHRMPAGLKTIIWIVAIFVVAIGIALGVIFSVADYLGIGFGRGNDCVVEIERGSSVAKIAEELNECGAVKMPILFRLYSKVKGYESQYKYGVYDFNTELGYSGLAEMLMKEGAKAQSAKVTIIEGWTVDDIAESLSKAGVCEKSDFIYEVNHGEFDLDFIKEIPEEQVHYRFEGYLFPETYEFYSYDSKECAHLAVLKMLETFNERVTPFKNAIKESGYSFHEIMSMASLVELEAGGYEGEMNNVAAVFFNRLKSKDFATLGSSPSRKYPYGNDRYNTYVCEGLPVGPLCSPGIKSIEATLNPTADFDYYYFVTDAKMNFYYKKTLEEHNAIIAKLKAENNWIYED